MELTQITPGLLQMALAPVFIVLIYVYVRDKYEKEPIRLLFLGVLYGVIITAPIIFCGSLMALFAPNQGLLAEAFFISFMVAGFVEEAFKFAILYLLVWRSSHFNEKFDGIVYAVFVSLGFAAVENILYVFNPQLGGLATAASRAVFSVPGHALFGVFMGYYFSLAKFDRNNRAKNLILALLVPWFLHGVYNFILLSGSEIYLVAFVPFFVYMLVNGLRKMKRHLEKSPFRPL